MQSHALGLLQGCAFPIPRRENSVSGKALHLGSSALVSLHRCSSFTCHASEASRLIFRHINWLSEKSSGTSLAVEWLELHLRMPGVQVLSLVGKLRPHMPHGPKNKYHVLIQNYPQYILLHENHMVQKSGYFCVKMQKKQFNCTCINTLEIQRILKKLKKNSLLT